MSGGEDLKEQLEEIEALRSILCDGALCCAVPPDHPNVTGSLTIVLPRIDNEITLSAGTRTVHVRYLPPLLLCFAFPSDYPSSSMPLFSLHSTWLHPTTRHRLTEILRDSWSDYRGMPVLFTWIELLKEESMRILLSQMNINLNEIYSGEEDAAMLKMGRCELLETFIEYNEEAVEKEFHCAWYDCQVCFTSKSGKECIRFIPCAHIFCIECVSEYYRQKLQHNMVPQLECLNDGCDCSATQNQIRRVLTDKEFEVYEQRLLEGTLDLMSDVVICPRISCQAPVIVDDDEGSSLASCSLCHYSFCILCRKTYHGVDPCHLTIESREKLLSQLETATIAEREEIYRRFGGKKQLERKLETLKSEQWIESNSKDCPHCRAKIEKNDGCNKMTCSKCGHNFCWLCGVILNKKDPYSHYNMPGSKRCFNRLFEGIIGEEIVDDWLLEESDGEDEV